MNRKQIEKFLIFLVKLSAIFIIAVGIAMLARVRIF